MLFNAEITEKTGEHCGIKITAEVSNAEDAVNIAKDLREHVFLAFPYVNPDYIENACECPICGGMAQDFTKDKLKGKIKPQFPNYKCIDCGATSWASREQKSDQKKWKQDE